jgi:hypothetical protein
MLLDWASGSIVRNEISLLPEHCLDLLVLKGGFAKVCTTASVQVGLKANQFFVACGYPVRNHMLFKLHSLFMSVDPDMMTYQIKSP